MKEEVFKVSDLQAIFESIQRDIDELKETLARIPKDRDYSFHVTASIQQEIERLEKRRDLILNLEVRMPLEALERPERERKGKEKFPSIEEKPLSLEPISSTNQITKKTIRRY